MASSIKIQAKSQNQPPGALGNLVRSKRLLQVLNQVQRVTGHGNYWQWLNVPELKNGIEIARIVYPLRYDVLVRRDFFSFYAAHRDLYASDWSKFIALTKRTSYYTWYLESEAVRTNVETGTADRDDVLHRSFPERVDRAVALYESVKRNGYTPSFPIVLKTAKRLLPPTTDRKGPPTGKHISAKYFLADGCHRLALLMALGYDTLPADYFRVKCYQEFSPFDSTSLLARRLMPEAASYFRFLSMGYTAPFISSNQKDFLEYIRMHKPDQLEEVLSVIRADGFGEDRPAHG